MTLRSFQRALVDLTLAPDVARALRHGDGRTLVGYDLTARERQRICDVVRQPGISIHCTLSRGNRFEVVAGAFPMTCVLLRPVLRGLVDELWRAHRPANYQLEGEQTAFAALVGRKLAEGTLAIEYLAEILGYELVCQELLERARQAPGTVTEAAFTFQHAPDDLLGPLSALAAPPSNLPGGVYPAQIKLQKGRFKVEAH